MRFFAWPWRRSAAARVSVIIPTYNRARALAALLRCLEVQTAGDMLEVIVCDDGSSDDTRAVAASFAGRLRLRTLFQPDEGFRAGQARNLGIAASDADLLVFLDDDQLVARNFVDAHRRLHERHGAGTIGLGYRHRTVSYPGVPVSAGTIRCFAPDDRAPELGWRGRQLSRVDWPWRYVYSCNLSVLRSTPDLRFEAAFTGWGLEDSELGFRLMRAGLTPRLAFDAPALHLNDHAPRDPFEAERRGTVADYASYVRNVVRLRDLHPGDAEVQAFVRDQLLYFRFDATAGRWRRSTTPVETPAEGLPWAAAASD